MRASAERTVPITFEVPINWAALMHWCALRHRQRWSEGAIPLDGEFSFDFTDEQRTAILSDFEDALNNNYENQLHALNNGFAKLLTGLSKNDRKFKAAGLQPDLSGLDNLNDPDDGIPF